MHSEYEELLSNEEYDLLLEKASGSDEVSMLYRAKALIKMNRFKEVLPTLCSLHENNPSNFEILKLYFNALNKSEKFNRSQQVLKQFISKYGATDSLLELLINSLWKTNRYDEIATYNEKRLVNSKKNVNSFCIAIQCFNKPLLLKETLASLINCADLCSVSVVILQDSYVNAPYRKNFKDGFEETKEVVSEYLPLLIKRCCSVTFLSNTINMGTAPSCRKLMDFCFKNHKSVMFIEDDFILAKDSLFTARYFADEVIGKNDVFFASCESVFFDSKGKKLTELKNDLDAIASSSEIRSAYFTEEYVPSTCFITNREIWELCGSLRGAFKGPETLNSWLKFMGKTTAMPVVPRGKDIGMFDNNGYSVTILGSENVKEIKSTYLVSEMEEVPTVMSFYKRDKNLLYSATVLLNEQHIKKLMTELPI